MATTVPLKTVYKARLKNIEKEMKENIQTNTLNSFKKISVKKNF